MIDNRLKKEKFRIEGKKPAARADKKEFVSDGKRRGETPGGKALSEKKSVGTQSGKRENWKGKTEKDSSWKGKTEKDSSWKGKTEKDSNWKGKTEKDSSWKGKTEKGSSWKGKTEKGSSWKSKTEKDSNWKGKNEKELSGKVHKGNVQDERTFTRTSQSDKRQDGKMRNDKIGKDERPGNKFQKDRGQGGSPQCPVYRKCGSCQLLHLPYKKQLEQKQNDLETLLKPFCRLESMIGMSDPYHYRNKVHAVFDHDRKGNPISGVYEANSHIVVPVESCLIEDQKSDEIIGTIRGMLKSFKIRTYDEDTGYGLLRHVLIRRGFVTGEVMVVLVTASPIFPSKNNFVKALRERHPEITTVIQNLNNRGTSMVLGDKENVLYGKGYIEDVLCGCRFRISSKSFYQVNPVQTEVLYKKAIELAGLTGKERVVDAYCGIGTIGIVASSHVKEVIGVELNKDAVRDAIENAKLNDVKNATFYCNDAGKFMFNMAESGEHVDVVFMDPPRSGSTEEFIDSVSKMRPDKVVYVSCGPETLVRDLEYFKKKGYVVKKAWGVDMFPWTTHVETCVLLSHKNPQTSPPSL